MSKDTQETSYHPFRVLLVHTKFILFPSSVQTSPKVYLQVIDVGLYALLRNVAYGKKTGTIVNNANFQPTLIESCTTNGTK